MYGSLAIPFGLTLFKLQLSPTGPLCIISVYFLFYAFESNFWCHFSALDLIVIFFRFLYRLLSISFLFILFLLCQTPTISSPLISHSAVSLHGNNSRQQEAFCSSLVIWPCGSGRINPTFRPLSVQLRVRLH